MKLLVATDAHIFKTSDGKYWCKSIYGYKFWKRYLEVFEKVKIVARVKEIPNLDEYKKLRVDGENVEVFEIPFYQGPIQLLLKYFKIHQKLKLAYNDCDVALFRMPSQTAYMTYQHKKKGMPFAGEIVYDPTDDLKDKKEGLIINIINRRISAQLKNFCRKANGVAYVTENTIQKNYPSRARLYGENEKNFETFYSTITLEESFYTQPRCFKDKKNFKLILTDVAMNSERKGERTLLYILKNLLDKGYDISAIIVGDGRKKEEFINLAKFLEIRNKVEFTGLLASAEEVKKKLLEADIFVFPTKAEGLPRSILEAMALGMPVLTSPVGGIPEIIDKEFLYDINDIEGYVNKICSFFEKPEILNEVSAKNFNKAYEFRNEVLQEKRNKFYKKLKNMIK